MSKKIIAGIVLSGIVVAAAAFYGGMAYGQTHRPASSFSARAGAGNNSVQPGQGGRFGRGGAGTPGGFTAGEVLSKDNGSVTLKLQNGSSQIVLVGSSTVITKAASGSLTDIQQGSMVSVQGSANSDGSMTAQSIQLRPAGRGQ